MPVEVSDGETRVRVPMEDGAASIPWRGGAAPDLDPDAWILQEAEVDPARFGSLSENTVPIPYRQQED